MKITLSEICEAAGGKIISGDPGLIVRNITTASNVIKGDDLFVPVKGARTDGHKYIASAFNGGAAASFMSDKEAAGDLSAFPDRGIIAVSDTVAALQKFAAYYRRKYVKIPYVGITGSVGKTTTREMTARALSGGLKTYSTRGNANSQVGVPITVTETDPEAEIGVIELGISEFGEMEKISALASCDTCVMTMIGISHMAQFGSQENILKEKLKILSGSDKDTVLFVNGDDEILKKLTEEKIHGYGIAGKRKITVRYFGTGENADVRALDIVKVNGCPEFTYASGNKRVRVALSVPGDHMVLNALCAMAVAELYHVSPEASADELSRFKGFEGRGNFVKLGPADCINDCYNASPQSMKSGLCVLRDTPCSGKKYAVLASMLELGDDEEKYHREVGELICKDFPELDVLYTYGDLAELIAGSVKGKTKVEAFSDFNALRERLLTELSEGDLVLLKGSNSMGLSKLLS